MSGHLYEGTVWRHIASAAANKRAVLHVVSVNLDTDRWTFQWLYWPTHPHRDAPYDAVHARVLPGVEWGRMQRALGNAAHWEQLPGPLLPYDLLGRSEQSEWPEFVGTAWRRHLDDAVIFIDSVGPADNAYEFRWLWFPKDNRAVNDAVRQGFSLSNLISELGDPVKWTRIMEPLPPYALMRRAEYGPTTPND